jgi:hypothetical protein
MLDVIRAATPDEACADVAGRLRKAQASAGAVWDAVHLAGAELNMRARGIVGIHTVTSANGLRYAWQAASDPALRFLVLLQGVGWMAQFRTHAASRDASLRPFPITAIEPHAAGEPVAKAIEEVFAAIGSKTDEAAGRVLRISQDPSAGQAFVSEALRHTVVKADEVHYYKYLAALVEDIPLVSPEWQPYLRAAIAYYVKGSKDAEPAAMKRAREALKGLA